MHTLYLAKIGKLFEGIAQNTHNIMRRITEQKKSHYLKKKLTLLGKLNNYFNMDKKQKNTLRIIATICFIVGIFILFMVAILSF